MLLHVVAHVFQNILCLGQLIRRAMKHKNKLVTLYGGLILENTVPRNANAIETCAKRAQPPDHHSTLQASNDGRNERTCHNKRANAGDQEERRPEQDTPQPPQKAPSLP